MNFDPVKPYNYLPPLPPKVDVETKAVLRKAISAGRALAELKGLGKIIQDRSMLINTLILQEAKASSEIENIITTNDALFKAFTAASGRFDPATADVGIAIGAGTDVAVETADIVLVKNNPVDEVSIIGLARATYRKMIQNLVWATGYSAFAIPLAAGVL